MGFVIVGLLVAIMAVAGPARAAATITRVSVASDGTPANGSSPADGQLSFSGDGRLIAFSSQASNLVPGDTNNVVDVFVHDLVTGTTTRASVASDGQQGDGESQFPLVSADGRFVAFMSLSSNLAPGPHTGFGVYVHDLVTGTTERANLGTDGMEVSWANLAGISADGRFIGFSSFAGAVPDDTNGLSDVFVRDRLAGTTDRVSVSSAGAQSNASSFGGSLSGDGRYVVFGSTASNLVPDDTNGAYDAFLYDRVERSTTRVSVGLDGGQANASSLPSGISGNGHVVLFFSFATNLVPGETNLDGDLFVRDLATGKTERVNVAADGGEDVHNNFSSPTSTALSSDGQLVLFQSNSNLAGGSFSGSNVFVRDRRCRTTQVVSIDSESRLVGGIAGGMSADGKLVAFASSSVPGFGNPFFDVFVRPRPPADCDRTPPTVVGTPDRLANVDGWYNAAVSVAWSVTDPEPSSGPPTVPAPTLASTEGRGVVYTSTPSCDPAGNCASGSISLSIDRTPPAISSVSFTTNPKRVDEATTVTAAAIDGLSGIAGGEYFVDADPGVGSASSMSLSSAGLSSVIGTSLPAGVHLVGVRVRDTAGNWSPATTAYLVSYDPNGGFVTGGGSIASPPGAYSADPTATGRAVFGFVAKYEKGATSPSGTTQFQFSAAGLDFHSDSYAWLVIAGARAQYKGSGTINGTGKFDFLLTAIDGQLPGGGGVDLVRMKIVDRSTGDVIYDNQRGEPDSSSRGTAVAGGSVVIHAP